ncbi:hypothetical protein OG756_30455 [Streptomyces sp. NBC_01310]|uniref:hypothetical protein n=1 Tax=Streptomyces sp. NBC_01310 TaxID=2903820 RepID=UPI0035B65BBB|nr:hypothetical protein OG756_30455 [Streptomyces sp. NBC_01310]
MVDPAEYDKDIPRVQEHLYKFERAFAKVRGTHRGRLVDEVRQALLEEFESEGLTVWTEVADDAARRIAEEQADEA